ncbi:protein naked cuticle homolog 2-like [Pollicipes pollicipes]|uniref:protein naked cuticle homolog 2-like n=1 Tax=Pollicipes pollicipes TaxID=41117 RepID=UPI0018855B06|nr:protein naked cuticle homolog 2-like [Pollicipes pollicipes]
MATILKWWKMKMLGGYKHMPGFVSESDCAHSALAGGSRRSSYCCRGHPCASSTDETRLYESDDDEADACSVASGDTPRRGDPPATPPGPASPGRAPPRDEFNFTLYDFDGHGKVTKDDIAGLVKAIYEVVGSSVHVPPSGSKTINVKLTVTPEQRRLSAYGRVGRRRGAARPQYHDPERGGDDLDLKARLEARRPRFNSMRGQQPAGWRGRSPGAPADDEPQRGRREFAVDPVRRRQLVEMLQHSMEKNNLKFNNLNCTAYPQDVVPTSCTAYPQDVVPTSCTAYPQDVVPTSCTAYPQDIVPTSCTPIPRTRHNSDREQLKHRNRERDHCRAMQQVLSWLEREHPAPDQKVEHHHMHEHVHHHYHHFPKDAVIL